MAPFAYEEWRWEPPITGDEDAILLGFLERQRATFAWKTADLDEAGLWATLGRSAMTLGGMLNMIEEYARHNGHADLIRESIDGRVGHDPPS